MEIKEFWEKCGLEIHKEMWVEDHTEPDGCWYDASGRMLECEFENGLPALTIDNLIEYVIPIVVAKGYEVEIFITDGGASVDIIKIAKLEGYVGQDKDLATALYKALRGVLWS